MDELIRKDQAAERYHVPERTLDRWRYLNVGPVSFKVGKRVVYRVADWDAWLREQRESTGRGLRQTEDRVGGAA